MPAKTSAVLIAGLVGLVTGACASNSPPSSGQYSIEFPSVAAAVSVDAVQLQVFDATNQATESLCAELILQIASNQSLTAAPLLFAGPQESPCDLEAGKDPVTLGYGTRALVAIGAKAGTTLLAGCTVESVGAGSLPVAIDLGLVGETNSIPTTTCTKLSDFCAGRCQ